MATIVAFQITAGYGDYLSNTPRCAPNGDWTIGLAHGLDHILGLEGHTASNSDVMGNPQSNFQSVAASVRDRHLVCTPFRSARRRNKTPKTTRCHNPLIAPNEAPFCVMSERTRAISGTDSLPRGCHCPAFLDNILNEHSDLLTLSSAVLAFSQFSMRERAGGYI